MNDDTFPAYPAISPTRLFEAADLLLRAEAEQPEGQALINVSFDSRLRPTGDVFTYAELIEAMLFLFRLGLVVPRNEPRR